MKRPRAAAALWVAAVFLRIYGLGLRTLWLDEAGFLRLAAEPLAGVIPLVRDNEQLPPLHSLLMHFWIKAFSDPLTGLRVFSMLCGLGALAAFYRSCRRLIPENADLAFAFAAFSSYWIDVAQSGRPYSLYLLLAAVQFDLLLRLKDGWKARPGVAYALVGALGLYAHYYFAFVLLAHAAFLSPGLKTRRAAAPWLATAVFWAAAFVPWIPSLLSQLKIYADKPNLGEYFGLSQLAALFGAIFMNLSVASFLFGNWVRVIGGIALVGLASSAFARRVDPARRQAVRLCLAQLAVPLVAVKAVELALGRPMTQARYFAFLSIPAYLLAALLLGRLSGWARKVGFSVAFLVLSAGIVGYEVSGRVFDAGLDRLAATLRRDARPGDVILHLNPFYYPSMRYYYLPELPHFLLDESSSALNWKGLPGYRAIAPSLENFPRVLIVDPERRFFPGRLGVAPGRGLIAFIRAAK